MVQEKEKYKTINLQQSSKEDRFIAETLVMIMLYRLLIPK